MRLVIHDLEKEKDYTQYLKPHLDDVVIYNTGKLHSCVGCFGCWVKTPGICVIKDGFESIGHDFSEAEEIIIVSQCCYGGYSPFIKNIWDRSISYLLPFFETRNGITHHPCRFEGDFNLAVLFYGDNLSEREMLSARNLIQANSKSYKMNKCEVEFVE